MQRQKKENGDLQEEKVGEKEETEKQVDDKQTISQQLRNEKEE